MFSVAEKQYIAAEIEKLLLSLKHPEMPAERPSFRLHVDGAESWSWADIEPNWKYDGREIPMNPWNEISRAELNDKEPHPMTEGAGRCEYIVDHDGNRCGGSPVRRFRWGDHEEWRCERHEPRPSTDAVPVVSERADYGFGDAVRCGLCPLLPDRSVICTRDCGVAQRDVDLHGMLQWFSMVTDSRKKAGEIADLCRTARDERDAARARVVEVEGVAAEWQGQAQRASEAVRALEATVAALQGEGAATLVGLVTAAMGLGFEVDVSLKPTCCERDTCGCACQACAADPARGAVCGCPTEPNGDCRHGCCDEEVCTVLCDACSPARGGAE